MRPNRKRLSFDIPNILYELLLCNAKLRNVTVTRWIMQAIKQRLNNEMKYQ
jgi:hypothetical protein